MPLIEKNNKITSKQMSMKSEKFNLCGRDYYPPTVVVEYVFTESGFATSERRFDGTNGTEIMGRNPYYEL